MIKLFKKSVSVIGLFCFLSVIGVLPLKAEGSLPSELALVASFAKDIAIKKALDVTVGSKPEHGVLAPRTHGVMLVGFAGEIAYEFYKKRRDLGRQIERLKKEPQTPKLNQKIETLEKERRRFSISPQRIGWLLFSLTINDFIIRRDSSLPAQLYRKSQIVLKGHA